VKHHVALSIVGTQRLVDSGYMRAKAAQENLIKASAIPYTTRLMLAGKVDGVSPDEQTSIATLEAVRRFARAHSTVYLPTHDPQSAVRLASRRLVETLERTAPQADFEIAEGRARR
jgi:hypothetical protein